MQLDAIIRYCAHCGREFEDVDAYGILMCGPHDPKPGDPQMFVVPMHQQCIDELDEANHDSMVPDAM